MEELWERLKAHFSRVDGALDDLRVPAPAKNIAALKELIGSNLTTDLIESLEIHDGQYGDFFLFGNYRLTPSDSILAELKPGFLSSLLGKRIAIGEIMVADNGGNAWLSLDLQSGAVKDVWEDGDNVVFPNYRAFLERVLKDLDSGTLVFDQDMSGYVVAGDAEAYWPEPS